MDCPARMDNINWGWTLLELKSLKNSIMPMTKSRDIRKRNVSGCSQVLKTTAMTKMIPVILLLKKGFNFQILGPAF